MQRVFFDFQNLKLSYLEAGAKNPRKILLVHANGYAAGCYDYILEALSRDYHVCGLDFAGHGESAGTLDFSSWNFFRDQILAFLQYKGWASCAAIGHSLGGGSLLRAAIVDAGRFEKIIAFDPVMLGFLSVTYVKLLGNPMAKVALGRRAVFKNKDQAFKIFDRHSANRSWDRAAVRAYVDYCIREQDGVARLRCDPRIESQIFSQTEYHHLFRLGRITCETQLVLPQRSGVCSPWVARRIARGNPRSQVEHVPDSGHLLPFERRDLTLRIIKKHL